MKNSIKIFLLAFAVLALAACKKLLDTKPSDALTPDSYYSNINQLNAALTSVYDPLNKEALYGFVIPNAIGINSDETFWSFLPPNAPSQINLISASDPYVNNIWASAYQGILRANLLLEKIDQAQADTAAKSVIKGEALFLRGFYHFLLVSYFGDVPVKLKSTQSVVDVSQERTPSAQVYEQIVKDMIAADGLVKPYTNGYSPGHVSKTAVEAMLAKVYLYWASYPVKDNTKYAEALKWGLKVKQSGVHRLNPDFRQLFINFAQDKYDTDSKENLWEAEMYYQGINSYTEGSRLGNINGVKCANTDTGYCYGQVNPTQKLFNSYGGTLTNCPDNRRDWSIADYQFTGSTLANLRVSLANNPSVYLRSCAKWRREYEPFLPKNKNQTGQNFPIIRYADVLLIIAEADNEANGPTSLGVSAVNEVRERAYKGVKSISVTNGGSGYTSAPAVTISGGGGILAKATAVVSGGKVTAVNVTYSGSGYSGAPTISFTGSGTGAAATAVMYGPADADLQPAQFASQDAFRQIIQDERMRELNNEGCRRLDLIRWGIYLQTLKPLAVATRAANYPSPWNDRASVGLENLSAPNVLLPIPASELSVNKLAKQNPGY